MPKEEVKRLIESGDLIEGELRVGKGNFERGYVANPAKGEDDFLIPGRSSMNRALAGDTASGLLHVPFDG